MSKSPYAATCFFVDLGRQHGGHSGSSNVILLPPPGRRKWPHALVIDCGDRFAPTADLLRRHQVACIEHFIITHNDADHCAGLLPLLEEFPEAFRSCCVWFLQDRRPEHIPFLSELDRLCTEGEIGSAEQLQTERNATPRTLFAPPAAKPSGPSLLLEVFYPTFLDNLRTQKVKDRNAASAILRLSYGDARAILFPGDGQIKTLERARDYFVRHFHLSATAP